MAQCLHKTFVLEIIDANTAKLTTLESVYTSFVKPQDTDRL